MTYAWSLDEEHTFALASLLVRVIAPRILRADPDASTFEPSWFERHAPFTSFDEIGRVRRLVGQLYSFERPRDTFAAHVLMHVEDCLRFGAEFATHTHISYAIGKLVGNPRVYERIGPLELMEISQLVMSLNKEFEALSVMLQDGART